MTGSARNRVLVPYDFGSRRRRRYSSHGFCSWFMVDLGFYKRWRIRGSGSKPPPAMYTALNSFFFKFCIFHLFLSRETETARFHKRRPFNATLLAVIRIFI